MDTKLKKGQLIYLINLKDNAQMSGFKTGRTYAAEEDRKLPQALVMRNFTHVYGRSVCLHDKPVNKLPFGKLIGAFRITKLKTP